MQVVLYNGRKTVGVVILIYCTYLLLCPDNDNKVATCTHKFICTCSLNWFDYFTEMSGSCPPFFSSSIQYPPVSPLKANQEPGGSL